METDNRQTQDLTDIIAIDILNDSSLFAVYIVDLETFEVIFANQSMREIMADVHAKNCWQAIYGQNSPCQWCKVSEFTATQKQESIIYEHFNEVANKWYQVQAKTILTKQNKRVLISFMFDISMQKEAQSQLINAHVQLSSQAKALEAAKEELKRQANIDYLTGIYNRRYFQQISYDLINIAKRESIDLSIIMLDIDRFKTINDTYGHGGGDQVLKYLSALLTEHTRDSDIVARIGGEEFAILLLNSDKNAAGIFAESLRKIIADQTVTLDDGREISFTASLGISAVVVDNANHIEPALNLADAALYEAKKSGRNKVVIDLSSPV